MSALAARAPAKLRSSSLDRLKASLLSKAHTEGKTHNFYHYPARCSHDVARAAIEAFSKPGDWVLDPFMGIGSTALACLKLKRECVGFEIDKQYLKVAADRIRSYKAESQATSQETSQGIRGLFRQNTPN